MRIVTIIGMIILLGICGCKTIRQESGLHLTKAEIRELSSKENITLSDSLRRRLIADSDELRLTAEEMMVLKYTGKVILCGKCGHILNSKQFKQHKDKVLESKTDSNGFVEDSLRSRILEMHID